SRSSSPVRSCSRARQRPPSRPGTDALDAGAERPRIDGGAPPQVGFDCCIRAADLCDLDEAVGEHRVDILAVAAMGALELRQGLRDEVEVPEGKRAFSDDERATFAPA